MNLQLTNVVKNLLILNVLAYFGTLLLGDQKTLLGLHYFTTEEFSAYQIVTHFFMHANFGHLFFNMYGLILFGPALESRLGSIKFINFYFITALGAAALHVFVQYVELNYLGNFNVLNSVTLGASGAIYGVLVGFALKFPHVKLGLLFLPIQLPALTFVGLLIAFDLIAGFAPRFSNIAHFAHLGGALFGFIMIKYWDSQDNNYSSR